MTFFKHAQDFSGLLSRLSEALAAMVPAICFQIAGPYWGNMTVESYNQAK